MDLLGLTWLIIIAGAIAVVVGFVIVLRQQKREADSKPAGTKAG
jgi:NADH:ubiquinone oxidoreductase subunit 6 (subunit J)